MSDGSFALTLYRGVGRVLSPALPLLIGFRARKGKEDAERRSERFGRASMPRPEGSIAWIHAASVGETSAVMPVISRLIGAGFHVVLTTTTVTSARVAADRLPEGAVHQFVPLDVVGYVRRFLNHWRPSIAIFVESEIWPAMLDELKRRGIPRAIVNGRLSERSWQRWRARARVAATVFGMIDCCTAQTEADAERFRDLGIENANAAGNLKYDVDPLPADTTVELALRDALGSRPLWVAASTHPGEEEIIIDAHRLIATAFPDLLTILVPRHPERGDAVADFLRSQGIRFARRSTGGTIPAGASVYLADTIGELGLFYRLAPVAFLGGSLVDLGGHNPIEAAQLGAALVTGPHTGNFTDVYTEFDRADAVVTVRDAKALGGALKRLITDAGAAEALATRAARIVEAGHGGIERTFAALQPLLDADVTKSGAGQASR